MAITKLNDFASGDANLEAIMSTLNAAYRGFHGVSITNFDSDSLPQVAVGSIFDVAGELFIVTTVQNILNWDSVSIGSDIYIMYDKSAEDFSYTGGTPSWDAQKGGWYIGLDRVFYQGYKDSAGTMVNKRAMKNQYGSSNNYSFNQDLRTESGPLFSALNTNTNNFLYGGYSEDGIFGKLAATEAECGLTGFNINGVIENGSGQGIVVNAVTKTTATNWLFYGYNVVTGALETVTITDGVGTFHDCSLIW